MKSFLHLLEDTEKKLGRQLYKSEVEFLQWVYERYTREQQVNV